MATLTEKQHPGAFVASDQGNLSYDKAILTGGSFVDGQVLGKIITGTAAATAGTNTGNGAMGAITVGAGAMAGDYLLKITKAVTNAGDFEVIDPQGDVVGVGSVAAAFSVGGLAFTLADGATDFVAGDSFTIKVTIATEKYTDHDPAATDGSKYAVAIMKGAVDASSADQYGAILSRFAEVDSALLTWKTGIAAADKAAGIASLKERGIVVR